MKKKYGRSREKFESSFKCDELSFKNFDERKKCNQNFDFENKYEKKLKNNFNMDVDFGDIFEANKRRKNNQKMCGKPQKRFYFMIKVKGKNFAELKEKQTKLQKIVDKSAEILKISEKEKITLKFLQPNKPNAPQNPTNGAHFLTQQSDPVEPFEFVGVGPSSHLTEEPQKREKAEPP